MTATAGAPESASAPLSRSFRFFLWTRFTSTAANQILLVALGWQMYDLTGSALDLGLVGLFQLVATLVVTLPAGHLADHVDRRKLLAAAIGFQAVAAGALAWGSHAGWISREAILGLSTLIGVMRALQMPASQALIPKLVSTMQLPRALAISSSVMQVAVVSSPALGGFIYALGADRAYGVCLAVSLVAIASALAIQHVPIIQARERATLKSLFAGFGFMFQEPVVLGAISIDLFAVVLGGVTALLPIYAKDILQAGPLGLGLLRAAPAVGALGMGAWLTKHPLERRVGPRFFISVAVFGASLLAFAFSKNLLLSLALLAVSGAADMVSVVVRQTLVQVETPDEMRGRVSAVNATFIVTSNQLGEFRAGTMAAWLGPVGSVVVGGIGTLVVVLAGLRLFPGLARRDKLVR
ncbi:MAG TPA: MFS transporter [Usitatibacter sp.]|nr:MFS transporter [Usitatibacter sp.]